MRQGQCLWTPADRARGHDARPRSRSRTDLDVLNAQQRLFNAQLDPAQARIDYLLGRIRRSAAAGELHEGDLHAINAYLDR